MPTIVEPKPSKHFPSSGKKKPPSRGRPIGSKNRLTLEMKWILEEAVRLNGGLEYVTKWMKKNPDLAIPMVVRALVPRALEITKESETTHIHVHRLLTESVSIPQRMASPPPPTRQKLTYDTFHPSASWGEKEPEVFENGVLIPNTSTPSGP